MFHSDGDGGGGSGAGWGDADEVRFRVALHVCSAWRCMFVRQCFRILSEYTQFALSLLGRRLGRGRRFCRGPRGGLRQGNSSAGLCLCLFSHISVHNHAAISVCHLYCVPFFFWFSSFCCSAGQAEGCHGGSALRAPLQSGQHSLLVQFVCLCSHAFSCFDPCLVCRCHVPKPVAAFRVWLLRPFRPSWRCGPRRRAPSSRRALLMSSGSFTGQFPLFFWWYVSCCRVSRCRVIVWRFPF